MAAHNNSARYYDFIFEQRFGSYYTTLTSSNIQKIRQLIAKGKVLDFGAGTGRITIPLAELGYQMSAVEKSKQMLAILNQKAQDRNLNIETGSTLSEIQVQNPNVDGFDLAISIFTVFSYITDELELQFVLKQIWDLLKPGGLLLFDNVQRKGYDDICRLNNGIVTNIRRNNFNDLVTVSINSENNSLFNYHEQTSGIDDKSQNFSCSEDFQIRFWREEQLFDFIINALLMVQQEHFVFANADYYVFKKL